MLRSIRRPALVAGTVLAAALAGVATEMSGTFSFHACPSGTPAGDWLVPAPTTFDGNGTDAEFLHGTLSP